MLESDTVVDATPISAPSSTKNGTGERDRGWSTTRSPVNSSRGSPPRRKACLGDPREGSVVLGPVVDMSTVTRCNAMTDDALAKGTTLVCGGIAENTLMPVTVLDHVAPAMTIYHLP